MSTARILVGDVREQLATLPDESVDCIVADPPYGETSLEWDRWPDGWPAAAARVLRLTGSMWVFGSLRMFLAQRDHFAAWKQTQEVVWEKHNGSNAAADRFRRVHELAVQFVRADATWATVFKSPVVSLDATPRSVRRKQRPTHWGDIGDATYVSEDGGPRRMRSVIYCRSEHGRAEHPTQKPVGLVGVLIEHSCPQGGHVLDLFAGSGSTAVAALRWGCSVTSIEGQKHYCDVIERRIGRDVGLPLGVA